MSILSNKLFLFGIFLLLYSIGVDAQMVEDNQLEGPIDTFHTEMRAFQGSLANWMVRTFYFLALIELSWTVIKSVLEGDSFDKLIAVVIFRLMFVGFWLYMLSDGIWWMNTIFDTMLGLGASASDSAAADLAPDKILDLGVDLIKRADDAWRWTDTGTSASMMAAAFLSFVALMILAANLALVLVEYYVIGFGGIFLLALGPNRWTNGYAMSYIKYVFSAGVRIFFMLIIAGLSYKIMADRIAVMKVDSVDQLWTLAGFVIIIAYLSVEGQKRAHQLISGAATGGGMSVHSVAHAYNSVRSSASSAKSMITGPITFVAGAVAGVAVGAAKAGFAAAKGNSNSSGDGGSKSGGSSGGGGSGSSGGGSSFPPRPKGK